MAVFISYAREDRDAALAVRALIDRSRHATWMDENLIGGEPWWDQILEQIRGCSAFVVVLSPESANSRACRAEVDYAHALARPIVPIKVRPIDEQLAPPAVASAQVIDFIDRSPVGTVDILTALEQIKESPPLPNPLPVPPPAPMSNLPELRGIVDAAKLDYEQQWALMVSLKRLLSVHEDRAGATEVLLLLRQRKDVVADVASDIDQLHLSDPTGLRSTQRFTRWPALIDFLREHNCTPVLGLGLTDSLLGPRRQLAQTWARKYHFPMSQHQNEDLPQVAQYVAVENGIEALRSALGDSLRRRLVERFPATVPTDQGEGHLDDMIEQAWKGECATHTGDVHRVLAELPVPIYVTAHPSRLLVSALESAGKSPVVDLCRWRKDLDDWPDSALRSDRSFQPSVERPLVFHLFGTLEYPESLVITEDDYFDYLINVTECIDLIPPVVRRRFTDSALMFLGFGLEEWDFRVLLRSLLGQEGGRRLGRYKHVAAQIELTDGVQSPEGANEYLRTYFAEFKDRTIDIYWGTVDSFATELSEQWLVSA